MTERAPARCVWCRRRLPESAPIGRPRLYCRRSCRQRAFESRRRLDELSWGEDRLQEVLERQDAVHAVVDGLGDLVGELRADVDDERAWSDGDRVELVARLEAMTADLRALRRSR